uniref:Uncharacterized protein n=1 Tax=Nannospalax galili TaxID=1026970 RepID=A0A8C6S4B0_NANGA
MVTVESETTPTTNPPPPTEDEKTESNQEVANPEHCIKYPLQNSKTWQANFQLISKFDTVEDFWASKFDVQHVCKYIRAVQCPQRSEKSFESPGTGGTDSC